MPDRDAGWQLYKETLALKGAQESECDIYGTNVKVIYHWEYLTVGDGDDPESIYPVIDAAFVGNEQSLFSVTSLIDDALEEVIANFLYEQRTEELFESRIARDQARRDE